jgi:hypothetical protein
MAEDFGKVSIDELVDKIMRKLEEAGGSSHLSSHTYSDQPILRKGSDWARDREHPDGRVERDGKSISAGKAQTTEPDGSHAHSSRPSRASRMQGQTSTDARKSRATSKWHALADDWLGDYQPAGDFDDDLWGRPLGSGTGLMAKVVPEVKLPPTLQRLRELEGSRGEDGRPLRGGPLFVAQARLASDFVDDCPYQGTLPYRYLPTYQVVSDRELRGYFTWRASWREGKATDAPATFAMLLSYELINGVGCEPGEPVVSELRRLREACRAMDLAGRGPSVTLDVSHLIRDYVVVHRLDPRLATTEEERRFGHAVRVLRDAEGSVLCRAAVHDHKPEDAPAMPSDEILWAAMGALSSCSPERSPFLRAHAEQAAHVGAGVFAQMSLHCGRRRKVCFVDGLLGFSNTHPYVPFVGVPLKQPPTLEGSGDIRLTDADLVTFRFGRWCIRRAYERQGRSRDLGRIIHAIDCAMREEWEFGRPLKPRPVPGYLQKMIDREVRSEHEREQEEERHRFTVDLSKLGGIRSAAATTREALLVDEEREGYVPGAEATEDWTQSVSPAPAAGDEHAPSREGTQAGERDAASVVATVSPGQPAPVTPQPTTGTPTSSVAGETAPYGLDPLELALVRALLAHEPAPPTPPGSPSVEMLVDSANEKLFDLEGDTVLEFGDDGPHVIEDYEEDLRGTLEQ